MGFLDGLGRFMQGKPIFEAPSSPVQANPQPTEHPIDEPRGPKYIPSVKIKKIDVHNNGSHMRITASIANDSKGRIELDKINLLGTKKELDTWLRPEEEREFIVFEGNRPNHRNYDDSWLDYRDEVGDYFQQYHTVEYGAQQEDGTYEVRQVNVAGPVKDI